MSLGSEKSEVVSDRVDPVNVSQPKPSNDDSLGWFRGVSKVASGTLLSRVLGAVRDAVLAATFSVGATDLFFVAFTIPNSLRVLLGEGAVSAAFVPVFTEVKSRQGEQAARQYFQNMMGVMLLILLGVTLMGIALSPWVLMLYAGGWQDEVEKFNQTVWLTRLLFPYIFLMGLAAVVTGALHGYKKFTAPAFAPIWLNVSLIISCFVLVPWMHQQGMLPISALAIGALIGGVLHVLTLVFSLKRLGLLQLPGFNFRHPKVKETLFRMAPLLLGLGVYQINVMLSRLFASFLPEGSQSYLYYGQRLVEIPQGMFALAIATVSLPAISEHQSRGDKVAVRETFRKAFRLTLFVAMPASVALFLLAEPAVTLYLGRGAFGDAQVFETVRSLRWLSLGVWAIALVRVFVPLFHALGDTKKPVFASALNVLVFVSVSLLWMERIQHEAIAVGMTVGALFQLAFLIFFANRKGNILRATDLASDACRILVCTVIFGASLWVLKFLFASFVERKMIYFPGLALVFGISAFLFVAFAKILHIKEGVSIFELIIRRERRQRP